MATGETHGSANGTDKQDSSRQLVEKIEIENTPFTAIRVDEKWFITMGKYRLTEPIDNKEEALAAGIDESWWRIMSVIKAMILQHEEDKEKLKEDKLEGIISKAKTTE